MKALILRGLSGSGKSTFASNEMTWQRPFNRAVVICSCDDIMRDPHGSYKFDWTKLREGHRASYRKFSAACRASIPVVISDNKNLYPKHYAPYLIEADSRGYKAHLVTHFVELGEAIRRSEQAGKKLSRKKMKREYEYLSSRWMLSRELCFEEDTHLIRFEGYELTQNELWEAGIRNLNQLTVDIAEEIEIGREEISLSETLGDALRDCAPVQPGASNEAPKCRTD